VSTPTVRDVSTEDDDPYDLVGVAELASALGVGRARADVISRYRSFPLPVVERDRIRLWRRRDVTAWLDQYRPAWGGWPPPSA
jgi:prophage regulatory protein